MLRWLPFRLEVLDEASCVLDNEIIRSRLLRVRVSSLGMYES